MCTGTAALSAQSALLNFHNFTTNDGLPSSETYFVFEDQSGHIWVGTDNGIARYNGYEFTVYDTDDGLDDSVTFIIHETAGGVVWVSTLSGRVFYFADGRFHPFAANDVLLELKQSSELLFLLDVLPDGDVVMRVNYQGIAKISPDGTINWLTDDAYGSLIYLYTQQEPGAKYPRQGSHYFGKRGTRIVHATSPLVLWKNNEWSAFAPGVTFENLQNGQPAFLNMLDEGNGILFATRSHINHIFPDGRRYAFPYPSGLSTALLHIEENDYFICDGAGAGLTRLRLNYETETVTKENYLQGQSMAMIFRDSKGGLWVASLDAGIFYSPYPSQRVLIPDTDGVPSRPTALTLAGPKFVLATYADGTTIAYDRNTLEQHKIPTPWEKNGYQADDIYYDAATRKLMLLSHHFEFDPVTGMTVGKGEQFKYGEFRSLYGIKQISEIDGELYWTGINNCGKVNPAIGNLSNRLGNVLVDTSYVHGLESYYPFPDGRDFIGTWYGMKRILPDGTLVPDNLGIPELSGRIERIVQWTDGRIAIATRANGLVIWTPDGHRVIGRAQNLASDIIRNLHVAPDGTLWVATLEGLSKVWYAPGDTLPRVRTFDIGNGLLDNEVHDIASREDEIWLASTAGVYQFLEPALDSFSRSPVISELLVNGDEVNVNAHHEFAPRDNYLTFTYSTVNFSLGEKLRYRYRVSPSQPWQISRERLANYPNLSAGDYRFEVQSENRDGVWSPSSVVSFSIAQRWIKTWQPWVLGGALLLGGITLIFRRRERERRREEALKSEIQRLEHSALHAQMNPHFVFNSLNSIQYFILHNDVRQAATYLSRFARLIRTTLRSSVRGQHSLSDEITMLDGYLELEQLRFKDVFEYRVTVDPDLPTETIMVPPLLIQPFVENAVLHGFKERSEGGLIEVHIGGTAALLEATVTDNGVGIEPTHRTGDDSLGMKITRQRLSLLTGKKQKGLSLDVAPIYLPNGSLGGTRVTLKFRPLSTTTAETINT